MPGRRGEARQQDGSRLSPASLTPGLLFIAPGWRGFVSWGLIGAPAAGAAGLVLLVTSSAAREVAHRLPCRGRLSAFRRSTSAALTLEDISTLPQIDVVRVFGLVLTRFADSGLWTSLRSRSTQQRAGDRRDADLLRRARAPSADLGSGSGVLIPVRDLLRWGDGGPVGGRPRSSAPLRPVRFRRLLARRGI